MKKFIGTILFAVLMLIVSAGCVHAEGTENNDYDGDILSKATEVSIMVGFKIPNNPFKDGSRYFTVTKNNSCEFNVDVNGEEIIIQIPEPHSDGYTPTNASSVSKKNTKIVAESKKIISHYVEASTVLKDKEGIISYINGLDTKTADFTDDDSVGAYFSFEDNCIYINKANSKVICEWMVVHELVHAISYYTHGSSIENEAYAFNLFNEVVTDIITSSMNPKISKNVVSGYSTYYNLIYPYIQIFKSKAIEAYFYGYDEIYEKINKDEFDFFVIVIENYGQFNTQVFYNNLLYKWNAK